MEGSRTWQMELRDDRARLARALEAMVVLAALATIPLTIAQELGAEGSLVLAADWLVWGVFFVEYAIMMALSRNRLQYARHNWLHAAIIVLSFPLMPGLLAFVRLARLARLFRFVRLLTVSGRGLRAIQAVLGRQGLLYVAAMTSFLILAGAGFLVIVEPESVRGDFWEGMWWAVVTVTTVGYGDIAPATMAGRLVAVVLMLTGVGLISTLAGSVTAYFVGQDERDNVADMAERLAMIEAMLQRLSEESRRQAEPSSLPRR